MQNGILIHAAGDITLLLKLIQINLGYFFTTNIALQCLVKLRSVFFNPTGKCLIDSLGEFSGCANTASAALPKRLSIFPTLCE